MVYRLSIASHSLGRAAQHDLANKLDQAQKYGYEGIEVFFEDLETIAKTYEGGVTPENQLRAATYFRKLCDERNLTIMALQPFLFYEGIVDPEKHRALIVKLHLWFKMAKILGTDIIQIPSNFANCATGEEITGSKEKIVEDLREVCDLGLKESPVVRFAYEAMAWSPYVSSWEDIWEIITLVGRPNFGCVLDTFHIAAREWADPSAPNGKTGTVDEDLKRSMEKMVRTVDVSKIYYIQVADAEFMDPPIRDGHPWQADSKHPSKMTWSRNGRLFAFEKGGYLPVLPMVEAMINGLGYKGWVSLELFSRSMAEPGADVPKEHARRGRESWDKLVDIMKLKV